MNLLHKVWEKVTVALIAVFGKFRTRRLLSVGPGLVFFNGFCALVFTTVGYWLLNMYFLKRMEEAYATVQIKETQNAHHKNETVQRLIDAKWADPKIRDWLNDVIRAPSNEFPAAEQCLVLFSKGENSADEKERKRALKQRLLGIPDQGTHCKTLLGLTLWMEPVNESAESVYGNQLEMFDRRWQRLLEGVNQAQTPEKAFFSKRYVQALHSQMQEPIRAMKRYNGRLQWVTVFVAVFLLFASFQRWLAIASLNSVLATNAAPELIGQLKIWHPDLTEAIRGMAKERLSNALQQALNMAEASFYSVATNLVALLPALGFVGTVLGLGDALLKADGLFSQPDKAPVISGITQDLGFAFDTTLVALICAPIAGLAVTIVRAAEHRFYAQCIRRYGA